MASMVFMRIPLPLLSGTTNILLPPIKFSKSATSPTISMFSDWN